MTALTIIGTYHLDHFVENLKRPMTIGRQFQPNDSRAIVDVHAIMPEPRQKKSSRMNKPTHPEQSRVSPMQKGDTDNPFIDKQKESASLELEIEATGKGNNANKGVANLRIFEEEEVAKEAMEVQVDYLEITTSVLENINIPIERVEESILAI